MKKRILALLLSGVLSLSMLSTAAFAKNVKAFDVSVEDGKVTVTGSTSEDVDAGNYAASIEVGSDFKGFMNIVVDEDGNISGTSSQIDGITDADAGNITVSAGIGGKDITLTNKDSEPATVYTVTFDLNYEGAPDATEVETVDGKVTAPTDPTREGYVFEGWFEKAEHEDGETAFDFETVITADKTLYAHWTEKDTPPAEGVTVTFHYNYTGAPGNVERTTDATSKKVVAWPADPTRSGYTFNGWYTASTGGTQVNKDTEFEKATDLYAQWTQNSSTDPGNQGGSSGSSSSGTSGTSSPAIKPLPDRNQGTTTPANPGTTTPTPEFFTDVPATHWAAGAISWVSANGYMRGMSNNTFNPDGLISRQQMWMILARIAGSDPANMAAARTWAMGRNLTDGTGPALNMSRQQLVTFLYRFAQRQGFTISGSSPLTTFPDNANVADYAQAPMSWAVANGLVAGKSDGRLDPTGTATRAQFATILQRFFTNIVNKNA